MFCMNCGSQMLDTDKFCPVCGKPVESAVETAAPAQEPAAAAPKFASKAPKAPKAPKTKKLLPIFAAAALVVVLVVILTVTGVFGGAKGKVTKAVLKTAEAYAAVKKDLGLDVQLPADREKTSVTMEVELLELLGYDVEGLGVRMTTGTDLKGRRMDTSATAFFGSADLITAQLVVENENLYLTSPELLDGDWYGINTMTFAEDLEDMGADLGELDEIGFNVFDLAELAQELNTPDEEAEKALKQSLADLVSDMEVKAAGKGKFDLNYKVDCKVYEVLIPQDSLENVLDALDDYLNAVDYEDTLEQLLDAMGMPGDLVDEVLDEMGGLTTGNKELVKMLEDLVDELGDLELNVYVDGGYVMGIEYETEIDHSDLTLTVALGGGKNYVDDVMVLLDVDGEEITVTSTGNHSAKGGEYTDETVIEIDGEEMVLETRFAPEDKKDNFFFAADLDSRPEIKLEVSGQVTIKDNTVTMDLQEVTMESDGEEISLRILYAIGDYEKGDAVKNATMLADMDEDDLMDLLADIEDNAMDWAEDLVDEIPELMYLI